MNPNHYGKAFAAMFHRSMSGKGPLTFAVWTYVCSHAYPAVDETGNTGHVELNTRVISALIGGCTEKEVVDVIAMLCSPDPESESKKEEGRRLVRISQFKYRVVNFMEYRNKVSDSPDSVANRNRQAAFRKRSLGEADAKASSGNGVADGESIPSATRKYEEARIVLHYLNDKTGAHYRETDTNLALISARLKEPDVTVEGVRQMIDRQVAKWKGTTQADYLRPATLFGKEKFDGYYAAREMPVLTDDRPLRGGKMIQKGEAF